MPNLKPTNSSITEQRIINTIAVPQVIGKGWHFTHTWNILAWPHNFTRKGDLGPLIYNYWLWNRLLSEFINLKKMNDCFISWKCFYCYLLTTSWSFWAFICLWFSRKTNAKHNLIGYWTTKERIWKESKSPVFPYLFLYLTLRGWYHFPDTCQDLFLVERGISQVHKIS